MHYHFSLKNINIIFFVVILILNISIIGQEKSNLSSQHNEKPEGEFTQTKLSQSFSLPFHFASDKIFVSQVNVSSNGLNILNDAANEPSIAFDFNDANKMAIGWRQFDIITNSFRQAGYAFTTNGGLNWNYPGVIEPGVFRSDPVLDSDSEGNFYYNSLTAAGNDYWCNVYKSTDGGATWDEGVFAQGGDKQWMVIDRTHNPSNGHIYAYWNASYSICDYSFTRSVDGGLTFEDCSYIPEEPFWGTLAVAKNGDVLICGYDYYFPDDNFIERFVFLKSTNAKFADSAVTFSEPVEVNMNGVLPDFGGPNPSGITGQINIASDNSDGINSGNIYILGTVKNPITGDPADIYVVASTDGGETWLDPVRVNDDESDTNYQWFGTLSVAPNGRVDVVWLDTRNSPANDFLSELYYSFSVDGGQTWYPNVNLLEESFDPHVGWPIQRKMGDYFDMVSDNEGVHLAWAGTFNGEQDVYYARIFTDVINNIDENKNIPNEFVLHQNYPNPFNPSTTIKFTIPLGVKRETSNVKLIVYDILGREIITLLNKPMQPGEYETEFDASDLPSGVYVYKLSTGNILETRKMLLLK